MKSPKTKRLRTSTILLAGAAFLFITPCSNLRADDKDKKDEGKQTATAPAKTEKMEEVEEDPISKSLSMLPIGKTNYGVKLPEYVDGKLKSLVIAGKLTPLEKDRIYMENVSIQQMDADGLQEMEISLITGSFDVPNEFLSSDDETVITRKDFTITGDSLDYDRKRGKGILRGKVKMIIRNEFFKKQAEPAVEGAKKDIHEGFERLDVEVDAEAKLKVTVKESAKETQEQDKKDENP